MRSVRYWVERLSQAMSSGAAVDLAPTRLAGHEKRPDAADTSRARSIPAEAIRRALTTRRDARESHGLTVIGARISGDLDLSFFETTNPLALVHCATADRIDVSHAMIPHLDLRGTRLSEVRGEGVHIRGSLLADAIESNGSISLVNARIAGNMQLTGAVIRSPGEIALGLQGARLGGSLIARNMQIEGRISLVGARIEGLAALTRSTILNEGDIAVSMDRMRLDGSLFAGPLHASGTVRMVAAQVAGQVRLAGASLSSPESTALNMDRARVGGSVLAQELDTEGSVLLRRATIGGSLNLTGAALANGSASALDAQGADLGRLRIDYTRSWVGETRLVRARIGLLTVPAEVDGKSPPGPLVALGWSLGDVEGHLRSDRRAFMRWLSTAEQSQSVGASRRSEFTPQPWEQVAEFYERIGQPADGRAMRIAAARRTTRHSPPVMRLFRWLYQMFVNYGYSPLRTVVWLAVLFAISVGAIHSATTDFIPASSAHRVVTASTPTVCASEVGTAVTATTPVACLPAGQPPFSAVTLGLATALPAAALAVAPSWTAVDGSLVALILTLIRSGSWMFAAVLLAGVTGLLRKS